MPQAYDPDLLGAEFIDISEDDPLTAEDLFAEASFDAKPGPEASVQGAVTRLMEAAVRHFEHDLQPDMVDATNYYYGRPFGDEIDGRSKVVSTIVRDATQAQLPQLVRVFTGPDRVVEYTPRGIEDRMIAEQMTASVEWALFRKNQGFRTVHAWMKDALVRRLGWVKWYGEDVDRVTQTKRTNATFEDLMAIIQRFGEVEGVEIEIEENTGQDHETGEPLHTVRIIRYTQAWEPRIAAVPPEEIVFTPNARDLDDAAILAHIRDVPKDELLGMGIPEDILDSAATDHASDYDYDLKDARQFHYGGSHGEGSNSDDLAGYEGHPSRRPVRYAEAYGYFDADGDGIAEMRMFQCVGPDFTIVNGEQDEDGNYLGEMVDDIPFAMLTPDPEPHTLVGLGNFDYLKDIQRIMSHIERGQLDSLAAALEPKTEVVMSEVNLKDLTNPEINGIVRVRRPGMMREITHQFVGPATLPVLQYYNEVKENRTGISKAAAGLDPDSLQSSTKAAVSATISGGQQHIWLIAQVFAETGFRRLFRGLAKLMAENMEPGQLIKLRSGQYVPVDPSTWDLDMDIEVNVAVGMGTNEEKVANLSAILQRQQEYMQNGVPFVNFTHIRNTITRLTSALGYRSDEEFFAPWGPEQQQQFEEAEAQKEPPPNLEEMLLEVERGKVQLSSLEANQKHAIEMRKMDLEEQKVAMDMALREFDIEAKMGVSLNDGDVRMKIAERKREVTS